MKKEAEESRQRNDYTRGSRNKWNRTVEGFNENTPWRVDRDKMYDKTHYYTDAISFNEKPEHTYSGEAIWRMYVMDKFYRDYKDEDGRVVGGYFNDRFQVDHDVSGNQMELADGERTRNPRPHQYSTERRLEEARGNKTTDLAAFAAANAPVVKIASQVDSKRTEDNVYLIFRDLLDMREAGVDYKDMISGTADHYDTSIINVAEIDAFVKKMASKHHGIIYESDGMERTSERLSDVVQRGIDNMNISIADPSGAYVMLENGQQMHLPTGAVVTKLQSSDSFEIVSDPSSGLTGSKVTFIDTSIDVSPTPPIQDAASELGLNEDGMEDVADGNMNMSEDFSITEV